MNADRILIEDNIGLLRQAQTLISELSDDAYAGTAVPPFNSGVGMHLRHILDFYGAFLNRRNNRIDYDHRERAPSVETDRTAAITAIKTVAHALTETTDLSTAVLSKNDDGNADPEAAFHGSTLGRELQFLGSHTVHHYAMIAMILSHHGVSPPKDFGVAPSTLAYWRTTGRRG